MKLWGEFEHKTRLLLGVINFTYIKTAQNLRKTHILNAGTKEYSLAPYRIKTTYCVFTNSGVSILLNPCLTVIKTLRNKTGNVRTT
jgi:hypothetical protein